MDWHRLFSNSCRNGLVRTAEHWRFSSAAWNRSQGKEFVDVPITPMAW